jgi:exodeoxyribonuclease III
VPDCNLVTTQVTIRPMFKVISWNVNSVNTRLERLLKVIDRHSPDVICLQELKCMEEKFPFGPLRAKGYHCTVFGQKTYNGVAILSREEPAATVRSFEDGADDPAARFVLCRFKRLSVASVYVPNGQAVGTPAYEYKLRWLERLTEFVKSQTRADEPLLLGGDFNVALEDHDVCDPESWRGQVLFSEPEIQALHGVMKQAKLKDTFRLQHSEAGRYSWWDYRQLAFPRNKGLRIDYLLASAPLVECCTATDIDREERKGEKPSDHAPCLAEFSI